MCHLGRATRLATTSCRAGGCFGESDPSEPARPTSRLPDFNDEAAVEDDLRELAVVVLQRDADRELGRRAGRQPYVELDRRVGRDRRHVDGIPLVPAHAHRALVALRVGNIPPEAERRLPLRGIRRGGLDRLAGIGDEAPPVVVDEGVAEELDREAIKELPLEFVELLPEQMKDYDQALYSFHLILEEMPPLLKSATRSLTI